MSCEIFENNNQLTLYTPQMFLTLDKDYNIRQKYEINPYGTLKQIYLKRSMRISRESYLFLLHTNPPDSSNYYDESEIRIYKENQDTNARKICIREIKNYMVQNATKAEISQNQLYLATLKLFSLFFYLIESDIEIQYFFKDVLGYLKFSPDSRQLCIISYYYILFLKCQQGLKKINQYFFKQIDKLIFGRNGINVFRYQKYRIRVVSSTAKKIIFTSKKFYQDSYKKIYVDYCLFSGIIMIYQKEIQQTIFYQLSQRKLSNLNIRKKNCNLVQNPKQTIILRHSGQLELCSLNASGVIFTKQIIMDNVSHFIKGQSHLLSFVNTNNRIIVLNQKLKMREEIQFDHLELSPIQVMENYILFKKIGGGISLIRRT